MYSCNVYLPVQTDQRHNVFYFSVYPSPLLVAVNQILAVENCCNL